MNAKFIADVMLGRLARWFRILGLDTMYSSTFTDREIIFLAKNEKRLVLTRDQTLARIIGGKYCLLLKSDNVFEQIYQAIKDLNIKIEEGLLLSRCPLCNLELITTSKDLAERRVPPYIFESSNLFKYCKNCEKFYWQGTHRDKILIKIKEILKK